MSATISPSTISNLRKESLDSLLDLIGADLFLAFLKQDPTRYMTWAGMVPDPWQARLLRLQANREILLCSRQSGKSQTTAAIALKTAFEKPGSLTLLVSPSLRQSGELFRDKVIKLYNALGRPIKPYRESALTIELENGSRILSLPGNEDTILGYSSVALLVVDEAAKVADALYHSVTPMLAISHGQLVVMSTPFGKRGWFYEAWDGCERAKRAGREPSWEQTRIVATECPRITPEFLAAERASGMSDFWYRQSYEVSFEDAIGQLIPQQQIDAAFDRGRGVQGLWSGEDW